MGKGPYDGETTFEYTRHTPAGLEPAYRCPEGATLQCGDNVGCVAANGSRLDPVFDSYPAAKTSSMHISGFRAGPLCRKGGDRVCDQSANIQLTGAATCPGGRCTRFGMEFDYRNADPSAPLVCATSTRGGNDDFIGDLVKLGGDAISTRGGSTNAQDKRGGDVPSTTRSGSAKDQEGDGMAQLLGMFGKVIASGDSPEDVQVSMTTLDKNGNPNESQRVGSEPRDGPAPIPRSIDLPTASGHLFVPMYQLTTNLKPGTVKERRITCTHKGEPVLETIFVLK